VFTPCKPYHRDSSGPPEVWKDLFIALLVSSSAWWMAGTGSVLTVFRELEKYNATNEQHSEIQANWPVPCTYEKESYT